MQIIGYLHNYPTKTYQIEKKRNEEGKGRILAPNIAKWRS